VRILAFSDLHRDEPAGRSLVERSPQPVLLVPGNNETDDAWRAVCAGWPAASVLHGEVTEIDDVTFFGLGGVVPVTPWDWSFDLTEQQAERMLTGLSPGADLLVHSPPKGQGKPRGRRAGTQPRPRRRRDRPRRGSVLSATCAIAVAAQAGQAYRSLPAISRPEGVF